MTCGFPIQRVNNASNISIIITSSCYWVFKMSCKSREAYWSHYAWHFETLQGCLQTMRKERVRLYNIYHEGSHRSLQHALCNSPRKIITEDTQFAASFAVWVYNYIRKGACYKNTTARLCATLRESLWTGFDDNFMIGRKWYAEELYRRWVCCGSQFGYRYFFHFWGRGMCVC